MGLLSNSTVSKENLPAIVKAIFSKGGVKEQQKLLVVMSKLDADKTVAILDDLVEKLKDKKLSPNLGLELKEAVDASGSTDLKAKLAALKPANSPMEEYADALYGGTRNVGRDLFNYNSTAQCVRCHAVSGEGGAVGPDLTHIALTLSREQLLQALVEPSARIAPGYGSVSLKLKDGQEVVGTLMKEVDNVLTIKTNDAEPLVIPISRIAKRENLPSGMPPMGETLSKREIRDIVEYLSWLRK